MTAAAPEISRWMTLPDEVKTKHDKMSLKYLLFTGGTVLAALAINDLLFVNGNQDIASGAVLALAAVSIKAGSIIK